MNRMNSPNLDHWDPMVDDYENRQFNSYAGRSFYDNLSGVGLQYQSSRISSYGGDIYALHVKGIPLSMSEAGLHHMFSKYGDVRDVKLIRPAGLMTLKHIFGKVYYRNQQDAINGLRALNETPPLYLKVELDRHNFGPESRTHEPYHARSYVTGRSSLPDERIAGACGLLPPTPVAFQLQTESTSRTVYALDRPVSSGANVVAQGYRSNSQNKMRATFCVKCQSKGTKCCTRCKTIYCSVACQKADWEQHRHVCELQKVQSPLRPHLLEDPPIPKQLPRSVSQNSNISQRAASHGPSEETGSDTLPLPCPQPSDAYLLPLPQPSNVLPHSCPQPMTPVHPKKALEKPGGHQAKFQPRPKLGKQGDQQSNKNGQQLAYKPLLMSPKQNDQHPAAKDRREQQKPVAGPAGNGQQPRMDIDKQNNKPLSATQKIEPTQQTVDNNNKQQQQKASLQPLRRPKPTQTSESKAKQPVAPQKLRTMPPVTIGSSTKVKITHISDPNDFYVQLNNAVDLGDIMRKIQVVDRNPNIEEVAIGQIVAAKYSFDGIWYRARVKKVEKDKLKVNFIDYGNDDFVTMQDLRDLSPEIADLPVQAVWCRLADVYPTNGKWSSDALSCFKLIIEDVTQLYASLVKTCGGQAWIALKEDADDIGELLIASGFATQSFPIHVSCIENWEIGTEVMLSAPTQEQTGKIWGSHTAGIPSDHVAVLFSQLGDACREAKINVESEKFVVGAIVGAQSPTDQAWYRGMILKSYGHTFLVRYLDFGNCERVVNICPLPATFSQYLTLAICFRVDEPYATECIPDEFLPDDMLTVKVLRKEGDTATVNVQFGEGSPTIQATAYSVWNYDNGFEVLDTMLEEANVTSLQAIEASQTEPPHGLDSYRAPTPSKKSRTPTSSSVVGKGLDLLPKIEVPHLPTKVALFWVESLNRLSVQVLEDDKIATMLRLTDDLQEACQDETSKSLTKLPAVGQLVCGQFSVDGMWNRCLVESVHENGEIKIRFIDFGNAEVTTLNCLRPLPNSFYNVCPLSLTIAIDPVTSVSLDNLREVLTPTDAEPASLLMTVMDDTVDPVHAVLTSIDGQSLEDYLAELTTVQNLKTEDEKGMEDLGTSKATEAVVGQHYSDDSAHCGAESHEASTEQECVVPMCVQLEVGQQLDLCIGDVLAPDLIMVFKCDAGAIEKYDNMATDITEHCSRTGASGYQPNEGDFCFAKSATYGQWFRALVHGIVDGKCKVLFPDYGNSEVVEMSDTRQMTKDFQETPFQTVSCSILGVEPKENGYNDVDWAAFKTFLKGLEIVRAEVVKKDSDDFYIIRVPSIEADLKKKGFFAN